MFHRAQKTSVMIVLNGVVNDSRVKKSAASLISHGYDTKIFGLGNRQDKEVKKIELEGGVEVLLFPDRRRNMAYGSNAGDKWNLLQFSLISEMWPHIREVGPLFVHSHDFGAIRIGHELVERLRSIGYTTCWVHDLHEYVSGLEQLDREIHKIALSEQRDLIKIPEQLITVSGPIASELTRDYNLPIPPTTIFNCPTSPGVLSKIGVKERLKLTKDDILIVYSGGLAKQRGLESVISSLKTLRKHHLCIVADKNSRYIAVLKGLAADLRVGERVHFVDYVDSAELPSFISDADIAIHPMLKYKNGDMALPNKLFDYIHSELPIVVGDCKTMSDFVERWGLGVSFETGNISSLIESIEQISDESYAIDAGAREILVEKYSWAKQEEKLVEIYQNAEKRMSFFLDNLEEIELSFSVDGNKIFGNIGVSYFSGPMLLTLFEDEDELCNFETGVDGDFMIDMGEIGDSKMHILEFKLRRWGQKAIGKIKCIFDKGEWEVSRLPLK